MGSGAEDHADMVDRGKDVAWDSPMTPPGGWAKVVNIGYRSITPFHVHVGNYDFGGFETEAGAINEANLINSALAPIIAEAKREVWRKAAKVANDFIEYQNGIEDARNVFLFRARTAAEKGE